MTDATRYPLSWPTGWPRTSARDRKPTTFTETKPGAPALPLNAPPGTQATPTKRTIPVSFVTARDRLWAQLAFLDVMYDDSILSSNVQLNSFGQPRADRKTPDDPGVAVYFQLHGKDRVLACDKWDSVAGNMAAIANHIDALRRVDRYGVGTLDQAFAGYDALPPPGASNRPPWRKVFGFADDTHVSTDMVFDFYKTLAKQMHPDLQGGSHEAMASLNEARDAALREIRGAAVKHPSDEFYEKCGIEALKALLPIVDVNAMTGESWAKFVVDVFDLTDALSTELASRLERNKVFREKDPEWLMTNAAPAASG